jgi:geranylgeranyl transferase type-2 subunit beta
MSLVSGPGRGGVTNMPGEMHLFVDKHVRYILSLDTVRTCA